MPVGYGVGDHRMFVIDLLTSSLIGCNPPKIVRAAARRLNTVIPGVEDKYVTMLEDLMEHHRLVHCSGSCAVAGQKWSSKRDWRL